MAFAGIKKQFNKTGQYISEKIGGVEGTRLDDEFRDLERKSDLTSRAVEQLVQRVQEYLQPNPATRAKMSALATLSSLRGDSKQRPYPQVEGLLGDAIGKLGREMTTSGSGKSVLGDSLVETGESFKQLAEVKYSLEAQVGQTFFEPLNHLTQVELKEMHAHRKKLESRRLDYDGKKRKLEKGGVVPPDELRVAEEKFEESRLAAEESMNHLLDNEVEQVTQLCELSSAMADYYRQALTIVEGLNKSLQVRRAQAAEKARNPTKVRSQPITRTASTLSKTLPTTPKPVSTTSYGDEAWGSASVPVASNSGNTTGIYPNSASQNTLSNDLTSLSLSAQDPFNFAPSNSGPSVHERAQQYSNNVNNSKTFGSSIPVRLPPPPTSTRVSQPNMNGYASSSNVYTPNSPPPAYNPSVNSSNASCKAIYDFIPENSQELAFKEGDMIQLLAKVDENWFEGRLNGRQGYFPVSYVQVVVPL